MKKIIKGSLLSLVLLLSTAVSVSAQSGYYDYYSSSKDVSSIFSGLFAFMGIYVLCYCCAIIFLIVAYIFTGLMIIDAGKRDPKVLPNKSTWLALMYFLSILGVNWIVAIIYFFTRKRAMDAMKK